jgi:hypothetical protein
LGEELMQVLVVEDDRIVREAILLLLRDRGIDARGQEDQRRFPMAEFAERRLPLQSGQDALQQVVGFLTSLTRSNERWHVVDARTTGKLARPA